MRSVTRGEREALYTPAMLMLILIVGISFMGLGFIMPLRALYGRELGASSVEIALMTSVFLLAGFVASPPMGWLADRFGYRRILLRLWERQDAGSINSFFMSGPA